MLVERIFTSRRCGTCILAMVIASWLTPAEAQINLSDIVAGGNGDGLGWTPEDDIDAGGDKYAAVNLDNGTFMTRAEVDGFHLDTVDSDGINPSPVEGAPFAVPDDVGDIDGGRFIDSVFFLNALDVPLNQDGILFPYQAGDENTGSWNHVLSNRTHDIDKGQEDIFAGGSADWETGIGIHASAGITFDLDAIRDEHGADNVVSFSTFIGADRCGALINFYVIFSNEDGVIDDPNGNASFTDGGDEIHYWVAASNPNSAAHYIARIPDGALYLTLTVGAGGNGIGCDHGVLADPQILDFLPPTPVDNLTCIRNADGDWDVSWTPQENPPPDPIAILVNGDVVAEVPNDASSYTIPAADAGPDDFRICVDNGAPFPSCCNECAELSLDPPAAVLGVDQQLALIASCLDLAGNPTDVTAEVQFSVEPEGIVSVGAGGIVTALALGEAEITATFGDLTATSTITVAPLLSLADMVAGGDGTGPGGSVDSEFAGINLDTGAFMSRAELDGFNAATADTDGVNPAPVDASDLVDSVFFLDSDFVTITTDAAEVLWELGDENTAGSFNHVLSNFTHDIDKGNEDIYAGGSANWDTGIGIHASAGISFDLTAIRDEHGVNAVKELSVFLGKDRCGGNISLMVIYSDADGVIPDDLAEDLNPVPHEYVRVTATGDEGYQYRGEIPLDATYLTLAVGANGDGIGCAHGVFADPVIIGAPPSEGASLKPGDVNGDGSFNISDAVAQLNFLFGDARPADCYIVADSKPPELTPAGLAILDFNGDGSSNISDPVSALASLFGGGPPHVLGEGCVTIPGTCPDNCQ